MARTLVGDRPGSVPGGGSVGSTGPSSETFRPGIGRGVLRGFPRRTRSDGSLGGHSTLFVAAPSPFSTGDPERPTGHAWVARI